MTAKLFLPKTLPITVSVAIRWSNKSTVRVVPGKHDGMCRIVSSKIANMGFRTADVQFHEIYQRYGIQFAEVSSELDTALRDFIHICQTAESV